MRLSRIRVLAAPKPTTRQAYQENVACLVTVLALLPCQPVCHQFDSPYMLNIFLLTLKDAIEWMPVLLSIQNRFRNAVGSYPFRRTGQGLMWISQIHIYIQSEIYSISWELQKNCCVTDWQLTKLNIFHCLIGLQNFRNIFVLASPVNRLITR